MGILLSLTALFSWGLGDFLIQRSARKLGDWMTLFYITAFGTIILFPFVYRNIDAFFNLHSLLLWTASLVILFAALLDFEALRVGKISIVEPVYALEIPVAALLAAFLIHERLAPLQIVFVATLVIGLFLVTARSFSSFKTIKVEKGVWYAVFATVAMGATNFLFGVGARETSPLMINWFTNAFIAAVALIYLTATGQSKKILRGFAENKRLILNVSFFDNVAWITFSYAMVFIPIAIATGISEGYIAFASALGIVFNKERFKRHQWIGFALVVVSVIILGLITGA